MTEPAIKSDAAEADYNVKVTVRNARLLSRIRGAGYQTVASFCRAHALSHQLVQGIINLRLSGMKKLSPQWRDIVIQLSDILKCVPQDIIPEQHWQASVEKNVFEVDMTAKEAASLMIGRSTSPDDNLIRDEVERILRDRIGALPPRLQRVVRLRFGLTKTAKGRGRECTLDEVGMLLGGVSRERVRQMEIKAYEKLRPKDQTEQNFLKSYIRDLVKLDEES
jgi:RNA polymerase sigma factor (sigma-70 family)